MKRSLLPLAAICALAALCLFASCGSNGAGSTETVPVTLANITGITKPVTGGAAVYKITETSQFTGNTGAVVWSPGVALETGFIANTQYKATITLTAKPGWTFDGIPANFFKLPAEAGATSVTNPANSGVVTAVFPATGAKPVTPVITIDTQPASPTYVTQGNISGSLTVVASVTGGATLSYQWYRTSYGPIEGAINASFNIPKDLTYSTYSYYYYCVISAGGGAASVTSNTATVYVSAPETPYITITSHPESKNAGRQGSISGTLSVIAEASNGAALTYQWYRMPPGQYYYSPIERATSSTYTFPSDLIEGSHYYYCEVSATGLSLARSDTATVTVRAAVPVITITSHTPATNNLFNFAEGEIQSNYHQLSVSASISPGSSGFKYQWYRSVDGSAAVSIPGETYYYCYIPDDLPAGTNSIYCLVSSSEEDVVPVKSDPWIVNVGGPTVFEINLEQYSTEQDIIVPNYYIAAGAQMTFKLIAAAEAGITSYKWYLDGVTKPESGYNSNTFILKAEEAVSGMNYELVVVVVKNGRTLSARTRVFVR